VPVPWSRRPEPEDAPPEHYWVVDLSGPMRDRMLKVMRSQAKDGVQTAIVEALELAERIDRPFTPPVDWDRLERWAQMGYPLVDQILDGKEPKGEPGPLPKPEIDPPGGMGT
jgi:hypothetical protein